MKKEEENRDSKINPQSQESQGVKNATAPANTHTEANYRNGFPNQGQGQRSQNKSK